MKQEKLYTVAGTTTINGETKVRFANDLIARIKIFSKGGGTVNLIELPKAMTKLEALQYLNANGFNSGDEGFAVASKLAEKTKMAKKGEVKVKAVKTSVTTTEKVAA